MKYSHSAPGTVPYLLHVRALSERLGSSSDFPYCLPFVSELDLEFTTPATFFVGENGSGKSTLIEALAEVAGFPAYGGSRAELADHGAERAALAPALRASFRTKPRNGYFFRAEHMTGLADLLERRDADPDFRESPYDRYGGKSLHRMSHGESFLAVFLHRLRDGLFIMDEPESALSPQRQLVLMTRMAQLLREGRSQFLIATHSPILLTFPGARILSFDVGLEEVRLEETSHYQITRGILESPERYWKHLLGSDD